MNTKPLDIFYELVDKAKFRMYAQYTSDKALLRKALEKGGDIPPQLKPGYLIESLSPEKREMLVKLTSKDTSLQRIDHF